MDSPGRIHGPPWYEHRPSSEDEFRNITNSLSRLLLDYELFSRNKSNYSSGRSSNSDNSMGAPIRFSRNKSNFSDKSMERPVTLRKNHYTEEAFNQHELVDATNDLKQKIYQQDKVTLNFAPIKKLVLPSYKIKAQGQDGKRRSLKIKELLGSIRKKHNGKLGFHNSP